MRKLIHCLLPAVACLLTLSCGQVGAPLPPLLNLPARAEGLRAVQVEDRVVVRWVPPLTTSEGAALRDLSRFLVYAVEIARDAPPASADALAGYFQIVSDLPADAAVAEIPVSDRYGQRTAFAVRGMSAKGKMSLWSDLAVLELTAPPAPPANLRARMTEPGVALAWDAAEGAVSYVIERAAADDDPVAVGTSAETAYVDAGAELGVSYRYRVRGRADSPTGAVPGPASAAAPITPEDTFPPAAPLGLRAIRTAQSVELSWSASPEPDLAGYEVVRDGEPLHEGLLPAPALSDRGAPAPAAYAVRAVDAAGNRSEPASIAVE